MTHAALVMSMVSATAAIGGVTVFAWPSRAEHAIYIKRIAGTMCIAGALILALFAAGLQRAAG